VALLTLNEPVVHALVARLGDRLPAIVTELNAATSDGFTIEEPVAVLDYVPPLAELDGIGYPTVAISDLPSRFEDDIGSSATGRHRLQVVCFVANTDPRALAWQLRRYSRAVATAALEGRSLPPDVWGSLLVRVNPGPTLEDEEDPRTYLSWTAVELDFRTDEG